MRLAVFFLLSLLLSDIFAAGKAWCSVDQQGVEGIRVGRIPGRTRAVFDLQGHPDYSVKYDGSSNRLEVTFEQVESNPPIDSSVFGGSLITEVIMHPVKEGILQFDFFLRDSPVLSDSFFLRADQNRGNRLVLDIYSDSTLAGHHMGEVIPLVVAEGPVDKQSDIVQHENPKRPVPSTRKVSSPMEDYFSPQLSGTWEHEWAITEHGSQKFETSIEPRIEMALGDNLDFAMSARLRVDAVGDIGPSESWPDNYSPLTGPWFQSENSSLYLRDFYIEYRSGSSFWKLGKQQVVWGEADGLKVLDVVNPQSYREFILDKFDDSRIPLWTVNYEAGLGDDTTLQLLWVPDTTYHELAEAGTPFQITSPRFLPSISPGTWVDIGRSDKPDDIFLDADMGGRLVGFSGGWDWTLNYFYHYHDFPVLYQVPLSPEILQIRPEYERNHLIGGTFSNSFGALTLRGEFAYNSDTFHMTTSQGSGDYGIEKSAELATVVGLDWRWSSTLLFSGQWFNSYLLDDTEATVRSGSEDVVSLLVQSDFDNAAWRFRLITMHSIDDKDTLWQLKLSYWLRSNLQVWLASDIFSGSEHGVFGQFGEEDRFLIGMEWGY